MTDDRRVGTRIDAHNVVTFHPARSVIEMKEYGTVNVSLIVYPAADLDAAKRFFREVTGTDPYVDSPQYVGYKSGDMEIGLIPNRDDREPCGLAYWTVDDIAASVKALEAAGGTVVQGITDVAYGLLVASLKDANGVTIGLRQPPKG